MQFTLNERQSRLNFQVNLDEIVASITRQLLIRIYLAVNYDSSINSVGETNASSNKRQMPECDLIASKLLDIRLTNYARQLE